MTVRPTSSMRPDEQYRPAIRALAERIIAAARPAARAHGYAVAVHGSLERDVDLLAVPWVADAAGAEILVEAIRRAIEEELGDTWFNHGVQQGGIKPHGRLAYTLTGFGVVETGKGSFPFVDLSVMPKVIP